MIDTGVRYVSVLIFNIKPDDFAELSREATILLQRKVPTIHGLVESVILGNEAKTQMLIVSQWNSRESWIAAQWDADVGRSLSALVESATSFDVHCYETVTVGRTAPPPRSDS